MNIWWSMLVGPAAALVLWSPFLIGLWREERTWRRWTESDRRFDVRWQLGAVARSEHTIRIRARTRKFGAQVAASQARHDARSRRK